MSRRQIELLLWTMALVFAVVGWRRWRAAEIRPSAAAASVLAPSPVPGAPLPADSLTAAARLTAAGDPFRLDRVPAPIAAQAAMIPGAPPPPPPPPKLRPPLAVSGIVGPPWEAMLEGVPDRQGTVVVRPGDVLGKLRVRSINQALVVVEGPDTTWRLPVRKPWQ